MKTIDQKFDLNGYGVNQLPLCPRCDQIVWHINCEVLFDFHEMPEFCEVCNYDLKKPINPIRNFFHGLFWGNSRYKYPLASNRKMREVRILEKSFKI